MCPPIILMLQKHENYCRIIYWLINIIIYARPAPHTMCVLMLPHAVVDFRKTHCSHDNVLCTLASTLCKVDFVTFPNLLKLKGMSPYIST